MSQHIRYFHWWIDTDEGWNVHRSWDRILMYKGYIDQGILNQRVEAIADGAWAEISGNFTILEIKESGIRVLHNTCRSFPLWYDSEQGLTNLEPLSHSVWADSSVHLDPDLHLTEVKHDIIGDLVPSTALVTFVMQEINDILTWRFKDFFSHNTLPVKIFLSGGVDTTLMWSYLKKLDIPHEVVLAEHLEFDRFWVRNHATLTDRNWAYKQIHHWREPTVLVSGCPGDEFSLRNPGMVNMICMCTLGKTVPELIQKSDMHYEYFMKSSNCELFAQQQQDPEVLDLIRGTDRLRTHLLDRAANDHQHWHLGNTLTFTPMRDLEILKRFLAMPWDAMQQQMFDSEVSKILITQNYPAAMDILSTQKNHENYLENLSSLIV